MLSQIYRRIKHHRVLVRFSSSSILLQGAALACNIIVLKWLNPEDIGLFQSVMLIQNYSMLVQAGILNGLSRELPFAFGEGKQHDALEMAGTAQFVALFGSAMLLIGIPVSCFIVKSGTVLFCVISVLISSAACVYRAYLAVTYRADQAFESLSKLNLVEALLTVGSLPAVVWFGLNGLAGRYLFLNCAGMALSYLLRPLKTPGKYSWNKLKFLLKTGLPLFFFGYIFSITLTFPRLILLSEGGALLVGVFAPASAIAGALQMIPASLANYIYPKMSFRFGMTGNRSDLWPMAKYSALGTLIVSIPFAFFLLWLTPLMIYRFFPSYSESIDAILWTVIAGSFMGASIAVNALYSIKAWLSLTIYTSIKVFLSYVIPWVFLKIDSSLKTFAAGLATAEVLMFIIGLSIIWKATHRSFANKSTVQIVCDSSENSPSQ